MHFLTMGGNAPLDRGDLDVTLRWSATVGILDASIYMLGPDNLVRSDDDMIFFHQLADPSGAVAITESGPGLTRIKLALASAREQVARIVVCLTVDDPEQTMADFVGLSVTVSGTSDGDIRFDPVLQRASQTAMRMVEFYRRHGMWRVRAIGQGFNEGLAALARSFGVTVDETAPAPGEPVTIDSVADGDGDGDAIDETDIVYDSDPVEAADAVEHDLPVPTEPAHPVEPPGRNDDQIFDNRLPPIPDTTDSEPEVEDEEEEENPPVEPLPPLLADGAIALSEDVPDHRWTLANGDNGCDLTIELVWQSGLGGAFGRARYLTLELGCFYQLADGGRGVVQTWDGAGDIDRPPFVRVAKAETVDGKGRQILSIKGKNLPKIKHVLLYAFIAQGSANWSGASAAAVVTLAGHPEVNMSIDHGENGNAIVALLSIDIDDQTVTATRDGRFAFRHPELDALFGWGLTWRTRPSPFVH